MSNNELSAFIKTVNFRHDSDGFFVGQGQNNRNGNQFQLAIFEGNIACFQEDKILFQVPFSIDLGTFLVLTQEFGIIHERFIYEQVESIVEQFLESEGWESDDDDDEDERQKQITQMKQSKFMQLLTKGKKKMN